MTTFLISEVKILDEQSGDMYKQLAALSIAKYGGKYLVRGEKPVALEGESPDSFIVIVEFPSLKILQDWYASPEYKKALEYRNSALIRNLYFVQGLGNIKTL